MWWLHRNPPSQGGIIGSPTNLGGEPLATRVQSDPITGYRVWRITTSEQGMRLKALNMPYVWEEENTAQCLPVSKVTPERPKHDSPAVDCACGLYSMLPDEPLNSWTGVIRGSVYASGTVSLYGRVLKCQRGLKAEYAIVDSPVVLDVECFSMGCQGRVETVSPRDFGGWIGHCAEHDKEGVEVAVFMAEAVRELSANYPNVEFIAYQGA